MSVDKMLDQYVGDITSSLLREAAMFKFRCSTLEATNQALRYELEQLKKQLEDAGLMAKNETYINNEPHK